MDAVTYRHLLIDLVMAIGKRWDGEPERRRANALSPLIEEKLAAAKRELGLK